MNGAERDRTYAMEIFGTIILSVASLAVAWCTYQSTLWNGKQVFKMAESNRHYREALEKLFIVWHQREMDVVVTINFLDAVLENRRKTIDYFRQRGSSELTKILNTWSSMDPVHNEEAPAHPLLMEEYKTMVKHSLAASDSAAGKAARLWNDAYHLNTISDKYILCTVIFSLVMVLCAVATKLSRLRIAFVSMLVICTIFFITLILLLILMPITNIS